MSSYDPPAPHCASLEEELEDIEKKQSEVIDLEEKERHLDWLQKRARELQNELSAAQATFRRRSAEAALPVIQPREPCAAPWAEMKGDERVRRCRRCKHHVYDLSSLTADEARQLIAKHEGELPTHVFARVDGTVTTGQCERERRPRRTPLFAGLAALGALTMLGAGLLTGYHLKPDRSPMMVSDLALESRSQPPRPPAARAESPPPPEREKARPTPRPRPYHHRRPGPTCGGWSTDLGGLFFYFDDGSCPDSSESRAPR